MSIHTEWREEVHQHPTSNVPSYCHKCNTWTWWRKSKAFVTRNFTNTREGEPTQVTRFVSVLKCTKCGHSVED